ncbi:FeoA family protein [Calderihabitans maritimus]|uniref:FeoA family protein n=1 Tax=Calderihabitans maritimus TaxID=1246530 RepID=A0A1Z5HR08_9FIRM|nr:ferrous iron transport protein A [Calderihabitans maritimus]GAW91868.1 FeoA family protein [Calderihabitans maritimus]
MTLDKSRRGQKLRVLSIPDERMRAQAIRFGITEGEIISCREIVPGGPIIVGKNKQEIAIGRGLARQIRVEPVGLKGMELLRRKGHALS